MMTDDLVKRMRKRAEFTGPYSPLWDEAADRIEELMKYKSLHAGCDRVSLDIEQKLVNQLATAHKRIEQLEAALRSIAADCEADYPPSHGAIKYAARAALAGEKKDG